MRPDSLEELVGRYLDSGGQAFHGRDARVSLACLDPADLGGVDAAAFGNLLLAEAELLAGCPQVGAEAAHASIVLPIGPDRHSKCHKLC
jgi:hypothetical protein